MKKSRTMNAYMTVEASFIMIWVIFLIIFLLYTSFYMYDRCVMFQDSYAIAFRTGIQPLYTDEMRSYMNRNLEKQFGQKYIAAGNISKETKVSRYRVSVHAVLSVAHPFRTVDPTLPGKRWTMDSKVEVKIMNPTKLLREMRKAEMLITK